MTEERKSAPFSSHSRGVPLFDKNRISDAQRELASALLDLRDIGSSIFWFLSMQSWLTLWSVIINIVSVVFYNFYKDKALGVPMDMTMIVFVVMMPLIGFIWILYTRRNYCLDLLSEAKCCLMFVIRTHGAWQILGDENDDGEKSEDGQVLDQFNELTRSVGSILSGMHNYFLPTRFYSRRYPYLGYKGAMIQIALDRSELQRQVRSGIEHLDLLSVRFRHANVHLEMQLREKVHRFHTIFDQLSNAKEFGAPQGVRAMVRCYICVVIPVFFGSYWGFVSQNADFALAFFSSIAFQIALTGLLNVSISLEDPFDNVGLNGIFIDEQLYEIEQAIDALNESHVETDGGDMDQPEHQLTRRDDQGTVTRTVRVATDNV